MVTGTNIIKEGFFECNEATIEAVVTLPYLTTTKVLRKLQFIT